MADESLSFNGINGATGDYLLPPLTVGDIAKVAKGEPIDPTGLAELKYRYERTKVGSLGPKAGVDPKDLAQTGWGVIFAFEDQARVPALKEALKPLLDLRREQANKTHEYYREYMGEHAYRPNESKTAFLARHGAGPGPADPENVPYYLLIVGDPERIPYRFQYQLDVQYAVGRIHFGSLDEYAQYAASVVAAETGQVKLARRAAFFGAKSPDDLATMLSANKLVAPLAQKLAAVAPGWQVHTDLAGDARKARLLELMGGADTPALLFTASHGMGFPMNDSRQLDHQGALLCSNWPGPSYRKAIPQDFYLAGDDIASDARLLGLIAFHFACYGAGTPRMDDFAHIAFKQPTEIAPYAFVSHLPQRLLAHPKGGALAVVGHVERAWSYSFMWDKADAQLAVFESTLRQLLDGHPIGSALEFSDTRYAELSTVVSDTLEQAKFGAKINEYELAGMWTANNDARSYVILGDPAVRLCVAPDGNAAAERPTITVVPHRPDPPEMAAQPVSTAAVQPPSATGPAAVPAGAAMSFGLSETLHDAQIRLGAALQQFVDKLTDAVRDTLTIEVVTYASDKSAVDITFDREKRKFTGAQVCAQTIVDIQGHTYNHVPLDAQGGVQQALWKIHTDMVAQAQANRTEMLKTAFAAASGLLGNVTR